ncbi:hypothetical protein [Lacunimicrobium album]
MKQSNTCPKCGSKEVIADAMAVDHGEANMELDMTVATFKTPENWLFKGKMSTKVSAWVCGGCGFVEFYADEPWKLRE